MPSSRWTSPPAVPLLITLAALSGCDLFPTGFVGTPPGTSDSYSYIGTPAPTYPTADTGVDDTGTDTGGATTSRAAPAPLGLLPPPSTTVGD